MTTFRRCRLLLIAAAFAVSLLGQEGTAAADSFESIARLAAEARDAGRVDEAISRYQRAIAIKPEWEEGAWYLATLLYSANRNSEALAPLQTVLSRHPRNGAAWAFKGLCEFELQHYDAALDALQHARTFGVGDNAQLVTLTRYTFAILLNRVSRFDDARAELDALVQHGHAEQQVIQALGCSVLLSPYLPSEISVKDAGAILLAGRAAASLSSQRAPEAAALFGKLTTQYPDRADVHYAYGVFLSAGQGEKAAAEFRRTLAIDSTHIAARLQLVTGYLQRHACQEALPLAREAMELQPSWYLPHQMLGRVLFDCEEAQAAVAELEKARSLLPDDPQTHFQLARAYTAIGREADSSRERADFLRLQQSVNGQPSPEAEQPVRTVPTPR